MILAMLTCKRRNLKRQRNFFEALKANYDEREVRLQLANLYLKQSKKDEAEEQLKKISSRVLPFPSLHPINFEIYHRLKYHGNHLIAALHGTFLKELEKGNIDEAIKTLEKSLVVDERSFLMNHNLALLYFDMEKIEKAASYLDKYLYLGGKKDKDVYSLLNLIKKRKKDKNLPTH